MHPLTAEEPIQRRNRRLFLGLSAAVVVAILFAFRAVLAPFVLAIVIAYVFEPLVQLVERRLVPGRPRWLVVLGLYVCLLGFLTGAVALGVPALTRETQKLARELPTTIARLKSTWLPRIDAWARDARRGFGDVAEPGPAEPAQAATLSVRPDGRGGFDVILPDEGLDIHATEHGYRIGAVPDSTKLDVSQQISRAFAAQATHGGAAAISIVQSAQAFVVGLVGGVFRFFITLMLSAYLLITKDAIFAFFETLVSTPRLPTFRKLLARMDRGLSGVVRGQLMISVVNGVLSGIGFWLFGLPYWPLLTVCATAFSVIPIFGAFISTVPAGIVALQLGLGHFVGVVLWILLIHQIEANLLNPKIMGDAAKVHPVLVVFALIAGEHFFGILGALLAVPVLSLLQTIFLHVRELVMGVPASESVLPPSASAGAS